MRFIILVKASNESEAGQMPTEKELTEMGQFNEQLVKAGVMLAGEGLHPSSKGARIRYAGKSRTVLDGPFAETKELVAGFWMIQVKSRDEAIEWMKQSSGSSASPTAAKPRKATWRFGRSSRWKTSKRS